MYVYLKVTDNILDVSTVLGEGHHNQHMFTTVANTEDVNNEMTTPAADMENNKNTSAVSDEDSTTVG